MPTHRTTDGHFNAPIIEEDSVGRRSQANFYKNRETLGWIPLQYQEITGIVGETAGTDLT